MSSPFGLSRTVTDTPEQAGDIMRQRVCWIRTQSGPSAPRPRADPGPGVPCRAASADPPADRPGPGPRAPCEPLVRARGDRPPGRGRGGRDREPGPERRVPGRPLDEPAVGPGGGRTPPDHRAAAGVVTALRGARDRPQADPDPHDRGRVPDLRARVPPAARCGPRRAMPPRRHVQLRRLAALRARRRRGRGAAADDLQHRPPRVLQLGPTAMGRCGWSSTSTPPTSSC